MSLNTKRAKEGYLQIDNRGAGLGMQEMPTFTCNHCQAIVVMNPLRTRERGYCRKCDSYVCDSCNATRVLNNGQCITFNQIADEVLEAAEKQAATPASLILLHNR